ncbi:hypothetical protein E3N88_22521 [Mikania micrantha]|uniref:Uncharacterized protein n=1 Tax=Mikania micrantha TaxID=192012 RepID=A0A5N6NCF4_9ASTR|nr:hypothetical protein E3N88_22521 [Mikania micrantha]
MTSQDNVVEHLSHAISSSSGGFEELNADNLHQDKGKDIILSPAFECYESPIRNQECLQSLDYLDSIIPKCLGFLSVLPNLKNGKVLLHINTLDVSCSNPEGIRNKGTGKSRRIGSSFERSAEKPQKAPRLCRTCFKYVTDHDSRNCKKKNPDSNTST